MAILHFMPLYVPPTVVYDADSLAFFNAVTAAGGSMTTTEKTAWNNFVVAMKTGSGAPWTPLSCAFVFKGNSSSAGINARNPGTYDMSFPAGITLSGGAGVFSSASSQYGTVSGTIGSILGYGALDQTNINQQGFLAFIAQNDATNPGGFFGYYGGNGARSWRLQLIRSSLLLSDNMGEAATDARLISFDGTLTSQQRKVWVGNRNATNYHELRAGGSAVLTGTTDVNEQNANIPLASSLFLNVVDGSYYNGKYYLVLAGKGMTTTQRATTEAAMAQYLVDLGV